MIVGPGGCFCTVCGKQLTTWGEYHPLSACLEQLHAVLAEVVQAADEMLAGGELAIRHAERCTECGHGGEGPLKDALKKTRAIVPGPLRSDSK